MRKLLMPLSLLIAFEFASSGFGQASAPQSSKTSDQSLKAPQPMKKPFVKLFTLIGAGTLKDTSDSAIEAIARNHGWINSHAGYWLKPTDPLWAYPFGPSAGKDAKGRTVGERLKAFNPEIILTNYRNGSYTNQNAEQEAGETEKRCPLAIAVYNTSTTLSRAIAPADETLVLTAPPSAPEKVPGEKDLATYPFKTSKTTQDYTVNKKEYVAWLRIADEIMRIDKAERVDGQIQLTVKRGIWGTVAAAHDANSIAFAPVYCGSRRPNGDEYYLSGLPDGDSPQPGLRYVMDVKKPEFWDLLADKSKECIDEGYDGPWFDCNVSEWINHSNAYGVRIPAPWDLEMNRELDHETYRKYQQQKLDNMFSRFPKNGFYVNWIFPRFYWNNGSDRKLFTNEEGHHPISGGAIEMYCNEGHMEWLPLMRMEFDMRDNNFRHIAWAKRNDTLGEHNMPESFVYFAYGTFLLVHEADKPMYWGAKWAAAGDAKEFDPPSLVYWDLGQPEETFKTIEEAEWKENPGIYARHFSKGLVLVNPDFKKAQTVSLPTDLYNVRTSQFTNKAEVEPRTALILLKPGQ